MEASFSNIINHPDRNDIGATPLIVPQYARYPPALEPGYQSASSLGSARSQLILPKSSPLHRKATPHSLQASPTGTRPGMLPTSTTRSGPSMSPPIFDPLRQRPPRDSIDLTEARNLPSRDITDESIDDAYVMFVFYCNPNVPVSADTSELRKAFRCPPRSDGKSFSIFTLWNLIRKLDSKELKTWHALAIELGVEPPVLEQKQSTQKVQQYAVRLKRWMRAMHVDAFFEYCLGHPHLYYTQLPHPDSMVGDSRDGVPLEEDLALRALLPQCKPKRGRKRAEDRDSANERSLKRPQLDTSVGVLRAGSFPASTTTFPQSAIPFSAFPEDLDSGDPWVTSQSSFPDEAPPDNSGTHQGQDGRWRPIERAPSPPGHPHSAIIPRGHHPSEPFLPPNEPRSAVTPSSSDKTRPKRRHGPAVSSAWPSNNGSSSGKARGRPPNKGGASGPFSSFPVNPSRPGLVQLEGSGDKPSSAIIMEQDKSNRFSQSEYTLSPTPFQSSRPNKLQLQVPQHSGGPVRLATPPTLMVNSVNNSSFLKMEGTPHNDTSIPSDNASGPPNFGDSNHPTISVQNGSHISPEDIIRVLSNELLRAKVTGRSSHLGRGEAQNLAALVVKNLITLYSHSPSDITCLMTTLHLGLGQHFGYCGAMNKSITVNIEPAPMPSTGIPEGSSVDGHLTNFTYTISHEYRHGLYFSVKVAFGELMLSDIDRGHIPRAYNEMNDDTADPEGLLEDGIEVDPADGTVPETTWRHRYLKLRAQMQKKERSLSQYKRKILESVMADI